MSAREKLLHFLKRKGTESSEESSSIKEQRLQERESEGETFSFRAHELSLYDFHTSYKYEALTHYKISFRACDPPREWRSCT